MLRSGEPRSVSWSRWWFGGSRLYVAGRDARLDVVVRMTLGSGSATVAGCAAVAAGWGLAGADVGTVALWAVCVGALVCLVVWVVTPTLLSGWQATVFAFVADIGVGIGLTVLHDRRLMFAGCMLFVLVGGFVTIHVPSAGLIMHSLFVTVFTVNAAVLMASEENVRPAIAVLGAIVWLWVLVVAPLTVRRIWVGTSAAADLASYDPLSGVLNRAGLDHAYVALAELARRDNSTMLVIAVDLDNFKSVNDRYGHQIGDNVIVETAQLLAHHFGRTAAVARSGGEEFTVIVVGELTALTGLVHTTPTATPGINGPRVTMSVGATPCYYRSDHDPLRQAIAAADHAMYTAKSRGGNSVELSPTSAPRQPM